MTGEEYLVIKSLKGFQAVGAEARIGVEIPAGSVVRMIRGRFGSEAHFASVMWRGVPVTVLADALLLYSFRRLTAADSDESINEGLNAADDLYEPACL